MKKITLRELFYTFKKEHIFLNRKTLYNIFLSLRTQIPELLDSPIDSIQIYQLTYRTYFRKKRNKIFFYTYLMILIEFALKFQLISKSNKKLVNDIKKVI